MCGEKNMKRKIAHIVSEYLMQGHSYIYEQFVDLEKFNPIVLTRCLLNKNYCPFSEIHFLINSVKLYCIAYRVFPFLFDYISICFFEKVIKENDIKLIHAHFGTFAYKLIKLKKNVNIPLIVTFYGVDASHYIRIPSWRKKYKKMFTVGDKFIALCDEVKERFINCGCPREKIEVWDIGINIDEFPYMERKKGEKVKFLVVARFREKKGYPVLLEAFSMLLKIYKNINLTIIGYGPLRQNIECQIKELDLKDNVILIDTTNIQSENFNKLFKDALYNHDIFVLPSLIAKSGDDEGGPPIVITNAQSTGMVVVSTPVGGISRAVIDGETGILAEPDNVYSLFEKMKYLMDNPDLWKSIGVKARKYIEENFNIRKQTQKLERIYESVLKEY